MPPKRERYSFSTASRGPDQRAALDRYLITRHPSAAHRAASTQYTVPCPWSVPRVPFSRKVRPNSEITTTTVWLHAGPSALRIRRALGEVAEQIYPAPLGLDRPFVRAASWVAPPAVKDKLN